ncbi:DMT family transporter [Halovulum dunhuangense]|uniref:DMT family transporter n=1 Tax=Halovulum dunhuangense TaxID=1505036 RepID=A0A849L1X0_9RHOB|nr:DMT family transporter [Halovulum dunhuangense]NNU80244.1 DMT family transporter [Halovulum dunhuangense]
MQTPPLSTWLLLLLLGMIWGGSFPANALALEGFGPFTIAALRIAIGAAAVMLLARVMGVGLPSRQTATGRRIWLHALGLALFANAVPFTLLGWGQQHVTSGFAGITMAGVPLLVLPLAHFLVPGERLSLRKTAGFALGFGGVVLLIGPAALSAGGADALPRLACIGAAACYACGSIVTRRAPAGPMLSFSAAALLLAATVMIPTALTIEGVPDAPGLRAALAAVYLGLLPTAVATLILVHVIQTAGPSFLSLVNYQVPLWAVLMGFLFLDEQVPAEALGALGLILAGLVLAQGGRRGRRAAV